MKIVQLINQNIPIWSILTAYSIAHSRKASQLPKHLYAFYWEEI